MPVRIVRSATTRGDLASLAEEQFGDLVKAVVDLETEDAWIEFDSVINIRPSQGNRSRGVDDPDLRQSIRAMVAELVGG
jgi:hypothetical protein